ncbi:Carbonic anhydrase (fragment) [Serratia proteamaculans]|uniref:carbonic anhydrase n=1 Tax=Serratia proteamaculans TaxID=28151 RepID=UPI0009F7D689
MICGHYGCGGIQSALSSRDPPSKDSLTRCLNSLRTSLEPHLPFVTDTQDDEMTHLNQAHTNVPLQLNTLLIQRA